MKINIPQLKKICETPGAPGFEKPIRDYIIDLIKPYVDDCYIDNIGNLITVKKGNEKINRKKVMVAAHMDEIGFIVTHITDNGFLKIPYARWF